MKKHFNALHELAQRNYLRAGVGLAMVAPMLARADGEDPFTTALATATTKVTSYASALVGFAAVAVVFVIAIKYVKKIPRAA